MRYIARPTRPDGTDQLGTFGVLTSIEGQYQSVSAWMRYQVCRYARTGVRYNLYRVRVGGWEAIGTYTA